MTQLRAYAPFAGAPYGSFERFGRDVDTLTQLGALGLPGMRYGSFDGRSEVVDGLLTQLRAIGWPGMRYGSFAGRIEVEPTEPDVQQGRSIGRWIVESRKRRNDDEEVFVLAMM